MTDRNMISNTTSDKLLWMETAIRITINLDRDIQLGYPIHTGKLGKTTGSFTRYMPKDRAAIPIQ
jgi:hypothetical protein